MQLSTQATLEGNPHFYFNITISGYNTFRGWTQRDYQNKHYNTDQKNEGTRDDQGRGGGTNFILRIKEQDNTPNPSGTWWCDIKIEFMLPVSKHRLWQTQYKGHNIYIVVKTNDLLNNLFYYNDAFRKLEAQDINTFTGTKVSTLNQWNLSTNHQTSISDKMVDLRWIDDDASTSGTWV